MLKEVADGAAGLVDHRAFAQPIEGVRDLAEHAGLRAGRRAAVPDVRPWAARSPARRPSRDAVLRAEDAAVLRPLWDEVVTLVSGKLVFRD